jgi:hypothetical protein
MGLPVQERACHFQWVLMVTHLPLCRRTFPREVLVLAAAAAAALIIITTITTTTQVAIHTFILILACNALLR